MDSDPENESLQLVHCILNIGSGGQLNGGKRFTSADRAGTPGNDLRNAVPKPFLKRLLPGTRNFCIFLCQHGSNASRRVTNLLEVESDQDFGVPIPTRTRCTSINFISGSVSIPTRIRAPELGQRPHAISACGLCTIRRRRLGDLRPSSGAGRLIIRQHPSLDDLAVVRRFSAHKCTAEYLGSRQRSV